MCTKTANLLVVVTVVVVGEVVEMVVGGGTVLVQGRGSSIFQVPLMIHTNS